MRVRGTKTEAEVSRFTHKQHQLMNATDEQIDNYIDNNSGSPEEIRELLKLAFKMIKVNTI